MSRKLSLVKDWDLKAQKAEYKVETLAVALEVSERELERFIKDVFHVRAKQFLCAHRVNFAINLIQKGLCFAEIVSVLKYHDASHLCREFKLYVGVTPKDYQLSQRHTSGGFLQNCRVSTTNSSSLSPDNRVGIKV